MSINQTRKTTLVSHPNFMGGTSFDIKNPISRLRMAAASCFFGEPMYYHAEDAKKRKPFQPAPRIQVSARERNYLRSTLNGMDLAEWRGMSPVQIMEKAIDDALDYDPAETLRIAVALRTEDNIRTTPQVIMVRAAHHPRVRGTTLISNHAAGIIQRPDELTVQLAYHLSRHGKKAPIPNSLKKAWRRSFARFNAYSLAKYRMENREVKLVDVMNLVHPTRTATINKLANGLLTTEGKTWEAIRSAGGSWNDALDVMGHMALLRNLRNLSENGVPTNLFTEKLVNGAKTGRQLPFRYYSAYKAVEGKTTPQVLDAIERAMEESMGFMPTFPGRVASLCDNSGSATTTTTSRIGTMKMSTIANLSGVITGKLAGEGYVGVFGDKLEMVPIRKKSSIFDELNKLERIGGGIGGSTENGIWLFFDQAIQKKEHWDHIFVYSDMQAGHGGLYGITPYQYRNYQWNNGRNIDVPKLIQTYRNQVNPNVQVFLVQVAGYQDTIIPEFYDKTYILGGWSDNILRFAAEMSGLQSTQRKIG